MKEKPSWGWKTYFVFYTILTAQITVSFFSEGSFLNSFFQIMVAFHKPFKIIYYINLIAIIVSLISLIPLFLFIYQKVFLSTWVWKIVFVLKVIFDLTGHAYEKAFLKSTFHNSPFAFIKLIIMVIIVSLPFYLATFLYAFKRKSIIPDQKELFD